MRLPFPFALPLPPKLACLFALQQIMDRTAAKEIIEQKFKDANVTWTEGALERLMDPRYLRDEALAEFADKENREGLTAIADSAIKRFQRRAKRSKGASVICRDVDTRAVARNAFGKFAPYKLPEPPKETESDADSEAPAEAAAQ